MQSDHESSKEEIMSSILKKKKKRYRTRGLTLEEWAEFEVEDIRGPVSDQMKGIMRSVY